MRIVRCASLLLSFGLALPAQADGEPAPESAARVDFQKEIAPILVARCIECHGPDEQKGDLRLDARAHLFVEGQEDFWTVVPHEPDDSELVTRLSLPLGDEEIMPNKGEPLSKPQQALFRRWVEQGAEWPAEADAWIAAELAAQVIPKITFELPAVDEAQRAAIAAAVAAIGARGGVVQRVAADTEALEVNLSLLRGKVVDADVAALVPLAPVLVWLDLSRTGVTAACAEHLAALSQLRRLDVANTSLDDVAFRRFASLTQLEYLNAYGTSLDDASLASLAGAPKLRSVYAWQSKVTRQGAEAARARAPRLRVDLGDYVEERVAAAEREIAERERRTTPVNDSCPVLDKPIKKTIFSIHEGRRVAFCCPKCKAAFDADPAKYAAKLPPVEAADK